MWSFDYAKRFKRWIGIALCRRTRQIVLYFIGDIDAESCRAFRRLIPRAYRQSISFSNFWGTYHEVITTGKHHRVGKESGEANHVERWDNTLRQRNCRFARKTLSISKSAEIHQTYLHLFLTTITHHPLSNTTINRYFSLIYGQNSSSIKVCQNVIFPAITAILGTFLRCTGLQ